MKAQSIILAAVLMIVGYVAQAQEITEPAVKILPTNEKGILKVLYAYNTKQSVNVKFFNEDGVLFSDHIKAGSFENGFSKKYDVRNMGSKPFFVEVTSASLSVTYKLTESNDHLGFTPVLENASYTYHALTARN